MQRKQGCGSIHQNNNHKRSLYVECHWSTGYLITSVTSKHCRSATETTVWVCICVVYYLSGWMCVSTHNVRKDVYIHIHTYTHTLTKNESCGNGSLGDLHTRLTLNNKQSFTEDCLDLCKLTVLLMSDMWTVIGASSVKVIGQGQWLHRLLNDISFIAVFTSIRRHHCDI